MTTSIDTTYWKRVDALLEVALALPAHERPQWLASLEGEDRALRATLEDMLARVETSPFMDKPVALAALQQQIEGAPVDQPGDVVGPYRLLRLLGSGGMGAVWSAERVDGTLQRRVALKLPRSGWSPGIAERLKRECEILSTLEHPNIARLYDAGLAANGRPYLAMESIEGQALDQYCRGQGLSIHARLRLFLQVARALSYAHARLVVHRDLKPSNILVDTQGDAHVVDFGLAKLVDPEGTQSGQLTQLAGRAFTPDYASPEQIRGDPITVGSDIYSLGVVLYELLAEKRPYQLKRETVAALEEAITEADVPLASSQARLENAKALRGDLDTIIARCLRKNVAERYPTVEALAADIERHLHGQPVLARPDTFSYRAGKFVRRHRAAVAVAAVIALLVVAGVASTVYQARIAEEQAQRARIERDRALAELRFAEATEEFTRFLLSEQAGRSVQPQELLRRANAVVAEQFAGDPILRARLQMLLSALHGEINDFKQTEALLRQAREAALAAKDRSTLAQVDCSLGSILGTTGREAEAEALFSATLPRVDAEAATDPKAFQVCHLWHGNYRLNRNKPGAGESDFQAALMSMLVEGSGQAALRIRLRANIADSRSLSGRVAEALQLYDEVMADLARIGRANTSFGLTVANNHMTLLYRAGRFSQVEQAYQQALKAAGGQELSSDLALNHGRALVERGRAEEGAPFLRAAMQDKARSGHKRGEAFATLYLARAECSRTRSPDCEALLERARTLFQGFAPPGHSAFAIVEYVRALRRLHAGDAKAGRASLEEAVRLFEAAPDRNPLQVRALSGLAMVLQEAGEAQQARQMAALAVARAREITGGLAHNDWVDGAQQALARLGPTLP